MLTWRQSLVCDPASVVGRDLGTGPHGLMIFGPHRKGGVQRAPVQLCVWVTVFVKVVKVVVIALVY